MNDTLHALARHHGLTLSYADPFGGPPRPVPDQTLQHILTALGQDPRGTPSGPAAPPCMEVPQDGRAFLPASLEEAPGWGVFCQLYELRSDRNWGIGDFADLADLARITGTAGADFLGINPVHALFLAAPGHCSPFSPSNRRFLNPLYIAPDLLPGATPVNLPTQIRKADMLDYPAIAAVKINALRQTFDASNSHDELETFLASEGEALRLHALFEAISAQMVAQGRGAGWPAWPEALRDPESAETRRMAGELAEEVRFHAWLQMIARQQLDRAQRVARHSGMRIGLYLDLAVGEAPDGSATWSGAAAQLPGLRVGAPPDMFAAEGQSWGLAAPSPTALRKADFAPFRAMVHSQLRSAGALRIDHAMALWQLFLIPEGERPSAGTHVRFPFADLLRILAEQSRGQEAILIGEDLGFVPPGFREAMSEANILSYRILVFEQDENGFIPPNRYPKKALASVSTHDLPTLSEWWRGHDIARRRDFGLIDAAQAVEEDRRRMDERQAMIDAFRAAGVLDTAPDTGSENLPEGLLDGAHRFLARTRSLLVAVRLSDLTGPEAPTNVPGTTDAYPNWRPRSPVDLASLCELPAFVRTADLMRSERPRPGGGATL